MQSWILHARTRLSAASPTAYLVPAAAVVDNKVFVVEDGEARLRPVTIGIKGRNRVEITGGLQTSDELIANPPAGLKPGERVRAKP